MAALLFILFLTLLGAGAGDAASIPSPAPSPSAVADFITTSCQSTEFPDLCTRTLAGYSKTVRQDPALLARLAISVSLSRTKEIARYVATLSRQAAKAQRGGDHRDVHDPRADAALGDCLGVLGDAVDQLRDSLKQMGQLSGGAEEMKARVGNVRTWISAALTNEETCTDGLEETAEGSPTEVDVSGRMVEVKGVTSNALALFNNFTKKLPFT